LINAVYPLSFRKGVEKKLRSRNIEVLLNTRVEDIPADGLDGSVKTTDGKTINSDLVVSYPIFLTVRIMAIPFPLRSQHAEVARTQTS
jgi:hypothetical protein